MKKSIEQTKRRKILLVIPSLRAGGAERIITYLSRYLDPLKFEAKLVVLGFAKDAVYPTSDINPLFLNKSRLIKSVPGLIKLIKKEQPEVIFGSIVHVNLLLGFLSLYFQEIKFIGRESSVITVRQNYSKKSILNNKTILNFFYRNLAYVVCQSKDMKKDFLLNLSIPSSKLIVINNPITKTINKDNLSVLSSQEMVRFVTVGRLCKEKGHLRILKCIAAICNYSFEYTIVGSGSLSKQIESEALRLGIGNRINFIPYTDQVLDLVSQHDYFLQGSYVEGFPNALLESLSVGTPAIAFNAPGGTKEILSDGINGFLVEDEIDFINVITNIGKLRSLNRENVRASVMEKFSAQKILHQYEELFKKV